LIKIISRCKNIVFEKLLVIIVVFQMKRISDFKLKYKDILENLVPEDEKEAFTQHNVVNVLTNRDHKGRRVLLVNVGGMYKVHWSKTFKKRIKRSMIV
jgi:hypothetical protein